MLINVIGLGYVGLPNAILLASVGIDVVGTDIDPKLISKLKDKSLSLEDEKLSSLLLEYTDNGLVFNTKPVEAYFHIIAVPTPFLLESKKVDLSHIVNAINGILTLNQKTCRIVIESTIGTSTIDELKLKFNNFEGDLKFIHAPERILPGNTYNEMISNNRLIGSDDLEIALELKRIYQKFSKGEIYVTDTTTSTLTKVAENAYRDINIAYANMLARISNELNINVNEVIKLANLHPRVNILKPGPGVGGHCIPVDPWFLVGDFPEHTELIKSSRKTNDLMPSYIANRIIKITSNFDISLDHVGIYGLTYKADVADFRESPSYQVINEVFKLTDVRLISFDPFVKNLSEQSSFENFVDSTDLIVILVDHKHIRNRLNQIESKLVFDVVNIVNKGNVIRL